MARPWFKRFPFGQSRLGRLIFGLNLLGLVILVIGALVLSDLRRSLIVTQIKSLTSQAELMAEVIAEVSTEGEPQPHLEPENAVFVLSRFIPAGQRARLFDDKGKQLLDSYPLSDTIDVHTLAPARAPGDPVPKDKTSKREALRQVAEQQLRTEVMMALSGSESATVRANERGVKIVSVSIPLKRVKEVLGVLTIEGGDVDKIVQAQRLAMLPFILIAFGVTMLSSLLLTWLVSRPIQRLSAAADSVRMAKTRAISLPDLEARRDEIGVLARSLESMTDTLWRRMEEIDRFAADVSHEIKNPLTSIRSALETLPMVKNEAAKEKLLAVINQDVRRADRLITDISNASRLDAELSRDTPRTVEIGALLEDVISLYQQSHIAGEVSVDFKRTLTPAASKVSGREGPLGQVFRNLIDNARSFSPPGGEVRVRLEHSSLDPALPLSIVLEDDGPGIPEDNLETIFQRFYTSRPKGTSFGKNSGLGLSISRQIIAAHGGRIWAENRKDEAGNVIGARFCILLPSVY
ncbi:ATP-binding protein [Asticcacaulis sp. 201]|uniref:ATP-binding protein n=1 Tax=Asticcacaulis sp. 201 TaxID=3028787 RepID=UPI002915FC04|nr:ATP-binding protein [Asticcacaulis sp. 201]MDV6332153.1 ATP-binding protein [Asticcacaulis sp. 201]